MNLENVIVCAVCLVVIAIVGYFMYTKVTSQQQEMVKLAKRCEAIEMMFAKPPPLDDLQAMYRPKYNQGASNQDQGPCESAMCDLSPLQIEVNEEDLDNIANAELSKVMATEKPTPRKKSD